MPLKVVEGEKEAAVPGADVLVAILTSPSRKQTSHEASRDAPGLVRQLRFVEGAGKEFNIINIIHHLTPVSGK